MDYLLAILVITIFVVIYVISYRLNGKIKIECDKNACEGCNNEGCIRRFEEEDK